MAQNAARIPAWRRLGLALKNQDDTGVAVPDPQAPSVPYSDQDISQHQAASATDHAADSQSLKLGKRKHQHEPVDHHHQEPKKSRVAAPNAQPSPEAHHEVTTASPRVEAPTEKAPVTGKPAKGGDSNYRKKKEKPPKRRKANQQVQQAPSAPHTHLPEVTLPDRPALLASTETAEPVATPQKPSKKPSHKDSSRSPPLTDRKKCVAFTPDTKKSDGNTGQDYFKAWVAQQKGTGEVSQPPEVSDFVLHALIADEEKTARKNGQLEKKQGSEGIANSKLKETKSQDRSLSKPAKTEEPKPVSKPAPPSTPGAKGKKKDPSIYIAYLTQYHNDRENWKFNKAKQNDVVDNALNIFRIPIEHSEALTTYVAGLQGAGVIQRLRERCHATLNDLDEQDAQMDDAEARKIAQEEAEQERIAKERKRRKTDGDLASLAEHPWSPGFIRRLQRHRAEALLNALGRAEPVLPAVAPKSSLNPLMQHVEPAKSNARKRKRRSEISSDESSSASSSDSDSSSDSYSYRDDSYAESDNEPEKNAARSDESESDRSSSSSTSSSSSSDSSSDSDSD